MDNANLKKKIQLGHDASTAANRLKKKLLFHYVKKARENYCFQCAGEIEVEEELSIEHKIPWLDSDNPGELFYDLDNISFSHLSCNINARRKKNFQHGKSSTYNRRGCRCELCTEAARIKVEKYRKKKKN